MQERVNKLEKASEAYIEHQAHGEPIPESELATIIKQQGILQRLRKAPQQVLYWMSVALNSLNSEYKQDE